MPRPFRLDHAGAFWHVHNRGVDRRDIFLDDVDRRFFLSLLGRVAVEYKWHVLAWTQMTNHYHLFIQTLEPTLSRGMQRLDGDYAAQFNRHHARIGTLFQSRFESHLVDSNCYLLELARYIVLNPVRAGIVPRPADWPWSSYRSTADLVSASEWLDVDLILDQFDSRSRPVATRLYRDFVSAGIGLTRNPFDDLQAGVYLGSKQFIACVEELTAERSRQASDQMRQRNVRCLTEETIAGAVEHYFETTLTPKRWSNELARLAYAYLARRESIVTFTAIAARLDLTPPAARGAFHRAEARERTDSEFRHHLDALRLQISHLKKRV